MPELHKKSRRQCHYYFPTLLKGTRKTKLSVLLKLLSKHTRKRTALLRKKKKKCNSKVRFHGCAKEDIYENCKGKRKKKSLKICQISLLQDLTSRLSGRDSGRHQLLETLEFYCCCWCLRHFFSCRMKTAAA